MHQTSSVVSLLIGRSLKCQQFTWDGKVVVLARKIPMVDSSFLDNSTNERRIAQKVQNRAMLSSLSQCHGFPLEIIWGPLIRKDSKNIKRGKIPWIRNVSETGKFTKSFEYGKCLEKAKSRGKSV